MKDFKDSKKSFKGEIIIEMAGAGAGGNPPHQDKSGFFASCQALSVGEEQLVARVEEEKRVAEWKEGEVREAAHNTLWTQFQQTAAALTQLYRQEGVAGGGREQGSAEEGWQPFQVAAGHLTMLYRESLEELRKASEVNKRLGYQKARGDLVTWARGRRGRTIRREDLLAFLVREQEVEQRQGVGEEDRLAAPVTDPAVQHSLLQMFECSRLGEDRGEGLLGTGGRKRGVQGDSEEEMESPQSKKSRFL